MMDAKVKDAPNLVRRDAAIINIDRVEYNNALARQQKAKKERALEARVASLESKLDTIIELLRK